MGFFGILFVIGCGVIGFRLGNTPGGALCFVGAILWLCCRTTDETKLERNISSPEAKTEQNVESPQPGISTLSGVWKNQQGEYVRFHDDGETIELEFVESPVAQCLTGQLTRRQVATNTISLEGTVGIVYKHLPNRHFTAHISSAELSTEAMGQLKSLTLYSTNWPKFDNCGKCIGRGSVEGELVREP